MFKDIGLSVTIEVLVSSIQCRVDLYSACNITVLLSCTVFVQCFACSVELGGHKKSHDYHVIVSLKLTVTF